MANQVDQYGREILTEKIETGGVRYFAADGSCCTALKPANDAEALRIFNENPPARLVAKEQSHPECDELIERIESMNTDQRKRLKAALLNVQK